MRNSTERLTMLSLDPDRTPAHTAESMAGAYEDLRNYLLATPKRKTTKAVSIVIVGGGIVGIMTAFYLRCMRYEVTILERESFVGAASGRNGGGILALGRDLPEIPFARVSIDLWQQISELGVDAKICRSGHLMVAMNEAEAHKLQKAMRLYALAGLDVRYLSPQELTEHVPDLNRDNQGGLFSPSCAQGYPFSAANEMVSLLRRDGVKAVDHCVVTGFELAGARVTGVHCAQGFIEADAVVLCAGPWTSELGNRLGVFLPVQPRRSQILATQKLGSRRIHPFVSGNGLYLRQTHAGNLLYGGGGPWEVTGYDTSNTVAAIRRLSTRLVEMFPSYRERQLIRAFAGTVELTPDHLPLLGAVPGLDNVYVSAGYNGHGYGMSAVAGKLLARMIDDARHGAQAPKEIRQLTRLVDPSRFSDSPAAVERS
ncbi:MAG TPA: FAD-binding oxidoreductase [Alicyclobacillus sp.]|nr:FAD-binding oxidoreductase [Alicyclobacillus sp.]